MIRVHLRDAMGIYTESADVDEMGPMPPRSTTVEPPALTGAQVASWSGGTWEVLAARPAEPVVPTAVPQSVEPLQGLLALDAAGLADDYEAWAADPARTFAERAFIQRAQVWRRNDPLLCAAIESLGMTPAQGNELFILAATL